MARIDTAGDTSWPVLHAVIRSAQDAGFDKVELSVDGAAPVDVWTVQALAQRRNVPGPDNDVVVTLVPDGAGFVVGGFVVFAGIHGEPTPTCQATFTSAALVTACENSDGTARRRCLTPRRAVDVSALQETVSALVRTYDARGRRNWSLDCEADVLPARNVAAAVGGMRDAGVSPQDIMASGPCHSHFEDACLGDESDLDLAEARAWGSLRR